MTNRVEIRTANKWKSDSTPAKLEDDLAKLNLVERSSTDTPALNDHEIDDGDDDNDDDDDDNEDLRSVPPIDYDEARRLYHIQLIKRSTANVRKEPERKFKNGTRMSLHFSNDRAREIERCNHILLKKILNRGPTQQMSARSGQTKSATSTQPSSRVTSATINRRKQQLQIDRDNELLLKKLQNIQRSK